MEYRERIEEGMTKQVLSAVKLIDLLIHEAYVSHASDLHLDPSEDFLTARLRVDGALHDVHQLPIKIHREMLARLKILAGLRIDEHQAPQDGRFRFSLSGTDFGPEAYLDVRVSIAPTYYGENAVLRLLSSREGLATLAALGLNNEHQAVIRKVLARPHGLILVTGPTGSGKTSTMYALLHVLNRRDVSIITIEDPIEYSIDGVNQIQANRASSLTFAEGLRSILRQDPNVIGIGEIRDQETAALAVHAALTGHLVLSTLHTTNAPSALPRLMDLGIEPYLVASTVSLVIGERLVRKLCAACRIPHVLSKVQREALSEHASKVPRLPNEYFVAPGCEACDWTGITGRMGLFEVLEIEGNIRTATEKKASGHSLFEVAQRAGMISLFADGLQKAADGLVAIDDVLAIAYE